MNPLKVRSQMIDKAGAKLSITRQCELLALNRSSFYYRPNGETALNLELMRLMDEHYLTNSGGKKVAFENFKVQRLRGKTREMFDYYPYGLDIHGLHATENLYKWRYSGNELQTGEWADPNSHRSGDGFGINLYDYSQSCLFFKGAHQIASLSFGSRYYQATTGRWHVPDPAEQFSNPYLAMGNTPVNGYDPNGEFFLGTLFTGAVEWLKAVGETQIEFYETVFTDQTWDEYKDEFSETWRDFDPTNPGTNFNNAVKIDMGSFKGDFGQVISRWTWELPQTLIGKGYGHLSNNLGRVNGVGYFDGATVVNVTDLPLDGDNARGVAFGSFIYGEDIAFDPFETFAGTNAITPGARLLRHEYGHYIQSQKNGWTYLFKYGLPSAMGADWTEFHAELRSNMYFREKYSDHPTTLNSVCLYTRVSESESPGARLA